MISSAIRLKNAQAVDIRTVIVLMSEYDEFYLCEMCRRQGIGSRVLALVEEKARHLGFASLHAETVGNNSQALVFWRKRGFQKYDRLPMVKMLKE